VSWYDEVFAALNAAGVRWVVVGGIAVVLSGHVRATVDLDVVVDLEPSAALRAVNALTSLGFRPRVPVESSDLADAQKRRGWVEDKHMRVLSFHHPDHAAREVDVFVAYPMDFDELVDSAVPTAVGTNVVPVAAVRHLIAMKRDAGRLQDLADVEALLLLGEDEA
jgi:hypothetical protein